MKTLMPWMGLSTAASIAMVTSGCGMATGFGQGRFTGTESVSTNGAATQVSQVTLIFQQNANNTITGQWTTPSGIGNLTGVMYGNSISVTSLEFPNAIAANSLSYPSAFATAGTSCSNYTGTLILNGNSVQGTLQATPSAANPYVTCVGTRSMTNLVSY